MEAAIKSVRSRNIESKGLILRLQNFHYYFAHRYENQKAPDGLSCEIKVGIGSIHWRKCRANIISTFDPTFINCFCIETLVNNESKGRCLSAWIFCQRAHPNNSAEIGSILTCYKLCFKLGATYSYYFQAIKIPPAGCNNLCSNLWTAIRPSHSSNFAGVCCSPLVARSIIKLITADRGGPSLSSSSRFSTMQIAPCERHHIFTAAT